MSQLLAICLTGMKTQVHTKTYNRIVCHGSIHNHPKLPKCLLPGEWVYICTIEHDSATDSATKRNGDGSQMHVFLERSQTQNSTYMTYLYNILEEARQRDRKKLVVVKGQDAHKRA